MTKNKKILYEALMVVLLIVLAVTIRVHIKATAPSPEPTGPAAPQPQQSCEELEAHIKGLIEQAGQCNEDSGCMATSPAFLTCPFGCYLMLNKNADTSQIEKDVAKYSENCPLCKYRCRGMPKPDEIKCINNKCVEERQEANL